MLAEWIALERRCCPFLRFQLDVDGDSGPVWLRLTGPTGVKDFRAGAGRELAAPAPMPEATDRYVPALGFDWLTRFYDPIVAATTREATFKRRLLEQADLRSGQRILDLGCGTGTLALWAKQRRPNAEVTGLDGDQRVLAVAREKARRDGLEVRFEHGFAHVLPYASASFDRVLSSLFLHHLATADKARALREVARVLRPGGELHVADWGAPSGVTMRVLFYAIQLLDGFENTQPHADGRLPEMLTAAGFERVASRGRLDTLFGTLELWSAATPVA